MRSCPKEILSLWEQHCKFMGWGEKQDNKVLDFNDPNLIITPDQCPFL